VGLADVVGVGLCDAVDVAVGSGVSLGCNAVCAGVGVGGGDAERLSDRERDWMIVGQKWVAKCVIQYDSVITDRRQV
jgi:hypothetical protein